MNRRHIVVLLGLALVSVPARASNDEPPRADASEQADEAPWLRALNEAFPQVDGAYEVRRFDLFVLLVRERFVDILMSVDPELRSASDELANQPYNLEKRKKAVGKSHPGMKYLQRFKTTLSGADLALPRTTNDEDRDLEYTKGMFVYLARSDDSNLSADMLALGIVLEDESQDAEPGTALTIGSWRRFKCWYEPADRPGEVFHRCGVALSDLPQSLKDRAETDFGKSIHARVRWHGLPRRARAKTVLIRGVGYETRPVLVVDHPKVEFFDSDDRVLWRAE
jgi:hypothetical protein